MPFIPVVATDWATTWLPTLLAISLVVGIARLGNRRWTWVILLLGGLAVLLDINRLQVWSYQWLTMIAVLALPWSWTDKKKTLQFLMIALYFWSGFNKLNVHYLDHSFPWLMQAYPFTESLGGWSAVAIITALLEMAIGIGFCSERTRKLALSGGIILHVIILLILGPLGHSWNEVVWPWNVAMILLLLLLFGKEHFNGWKAFLSKSWIRGALVLLWGILPGLNIIHFWDEQLSFKMYSGAYTEGILYGPAESTECFPDLVNFYYNRLSVDRLEKRFILDDWTMEEMGIPPYVSNRTMKQIARQWCTCINDPSNSGLEILTVDRWSRKERPLIQYSCTELAGK